MTEEELIEQREGLRLRLAEIKSIADGIDFKNDGRKRWANCKKEIVKLQLEIESVSRKINAMRKEKIELNNKTFDANFVAIARSILEEDLFSEIASLAKGVTK